jgi:hypothetical protein
MLPAALTWPAILADGDAVLEAEEPEADDPPVVVAVLDAPLEEKLPVAFEATWEPPIPPPTTG